jgi:hypothetical protein
MKINFSLLKRLWHRARTGEVVDLKSYASSVRTLCSQEEKLSRPAIFPSGSLDKITKLSPWRSWDEERPLWEGGKVTHGASLAYEIQGVELAGSYLYSGAAKRQIGKDGQQLVFPGRPALETLSKANLLTSLSGSQFFGTLLVDDFPLGLISENHPDNISIQDEPRVHELGYRNLLDLPRAESKLRAAIGTLTLYEDFAQNSFKAERYRRLRKRIESKIRPDQRAVPGVYIRRGSDGEPRHLENELEIEQLLVTHGFDIIDPATMNAEEIVHRAYGAKIIAGVEGSQMSHGIYAAAENAAFLIFQPPWRFSMSYKEFVDCLDMRFAFVVGETSAAGFVLDCGEVEDCVLMLD